MPSRDAPALDDHVVALLADAFSGDVADEAADLLHLRLVVLTGLRDQRRIGGHAIDDAPFDARLHLVVLGGDEEQLHRCVSCSIDADASALPFALAKASAASTKFAKRGCGRFGRDLNSGWNCVPR